MEIRPVRPGEYDEAGRVTAIAYQELVPPDPSPGWVEYLDSIADIAGRVDRTTVLVAVQNGRIVGSATIEIDSTIGDDDRELPPDVAALRMLGVDPSVRRAGIGRALVQASMDAARARGKRRFILRTTHRMTSAQRLYESMGFRRDPSLDMSFPDVELLGYRIDLDA
ncbi:MAG TPA: GNAT family N-acetyltransferase [Actinomycetota bacterium]|nr:GNAT family N-acetyltransferase [Actinomycetota bacterium]